MTVLERCKGRLGPNIPPTRAERRVTMEDFMCGILKNGKIPTPEELKEHASKDGNWLDPILALMLLTLLAPRHDSGAEYWRGKYEALKELLEQK